jgi:hypothetical protein
MICHNCGKTFPGQQHLGGPSACPECRQRVTAAFPGNDRTTDTTFTAGLPIKVEAELAGPAQLGVMYARNAGLDLHEASDPKVENASVATKLKQQWQASLPAVPSAYQSSGALPPSALIAMALGAGLGVILSVLAELVTGAVTLGAIALLRFLVLGVRSGWVAIFAGLLMLIAGVLPFVAGGWVSARMTTRFGRWGKNRNKVVAQFLSVTSAGVAAATVAGLLYAFGTGLLDEWLSIDSERPEFRLVYGSGAALAAAIAMGVAGSVAATHVERDKFCEDCALFMRSLKVKSLRLGALRAITRAASERNTEVIASLLHSPAGPDGTVELFWCPDCGGGFVEVTAHFQARWPGTDGEQRMNESWLVASLKLPAAEMCRFPLAPCDEMPRAPRSAPRLPAPEREGS